MKSNSNLTATDRAVHQREVQFLRDRLIQDRFLHNLEILSEETVTPSVLSEWYPEKRRRTLLKGGLKLTVRCPGTIGHAVCSVQHWVNDRYWVHVSYVAPHGASFTRLSLSSSADQLLDHFSACMQTLVTEHRSQVARTRNASSGDPVAAR
jgi:hypothetical protein